MLNQMDSKADIEIDFTDGLLTVTATKDGAPYDLKVMITLHILVPDAPLMESQPAGAAAGAEVVANA
ncbi:hypothetical protein QNM99_03925 [Pseudomonas sp. PCH446]